MILMWISWKYLWCFAEILMWMEIFWYVIEILMCFRQRSPLSNGWYFISISFYHSISSHQLFPISLSFSLLAISLFIFQYFLNSPQNHTILLQNYSTGKRLRRENNLGPVFLIGKDSRTSVTEGRGVEVDKIPTNEHTVRVFYQVCYHHPMYARGYFTRGVS